VRGWSPQRIAHAAGARLLVPPPTATGPEQVTIDSRQAGPGALFVGLKGQRVDGGRFAADALASGAWGVLVGNEHAEVARCAVAGVLLAADDPLAALQRLAQSWRRTLGAKVIGVTGSTGKTTTKDLLLALLTPARRTVASRANFNTEIGLPLEILAAPEETDVLVLEHAMRGRGQIAELAAISEPDVAVIVNIGPVHLELLGSIEAISAAKAELIAALKLGGTAIVPAGERLLDPYLRDEVDVLRFGPGGDVELVCASESGSGATLQIRVRDDVTELQVPFSQAHLLTDLLAAVAAASAVGVTPSGRLEVAFSPSRGQRLTLPGGITLIDDCYNANPMSMRAALDDLARTANGDSGARTIAVLGDMLELGEAEREFHAEIGRHAQASGVDVLVTVGPLAAEMTDAFDGETYAVADAGEAAALVPELLLPGDVVLVKASRGVGLELVSESLIESDS
jgi:UDP-N-acetylmuramoyl-tripeptide--D-alanyl-D-alanine ligase